MAYSKVSNKTQDKDIKYLNKDYNSFKDQLMEFAEVYFPNNFNDFSEGNPGMMFLEMAAYVGDVLSFYTDTQLRESFLLLAQEDENLYNLAYTMGYKPKVTTPSSAMLDIYQLVPSTLKGDGMEGYVPDFDYALTIGQNSSFVSTEGPKFYTVDPVRFNFSSSLDPTDDSIYQYDSDGNPEYYLLKKKVKSISGEVLTQAFSIGTAEKYKTINLFNSNIISIESITDDEGNIWSEVPYLAQDTMFEEIENTAANDPELHGFNHQTPYLLKLKKVPKRFVSRFKTRNEVEIQFGPGSSDNSDPLITPDPNNIGLGIKDGRSKLDTAYDPSNFMYTKAYGQSPANTILTVKYLIGGGLKSNVGIDTINTVDSINTTPKPNLPIAMSNFVRGSIAANNSEPARGGGGGDTKDEIRMNTMANFSAQQRTVTKNDYLIRTLSMPSRFGQVAKAYITQDDQISPNTNELNRIPNPLALNLYTLGYDNDKKITTLNTATKNNLMTYLEQYRMLTDAVNIKDGFVINFEMEFEITAFKNYNNQQVLLDCITEIKDHFSIEKWQINQPIIISEVENILAGIKGVQTVEKVEFKNKAGASLGYSQYKYDFKGATIKRVIYPSLDPSIFELKFPDTDIKGRITTY
tara:strand:- start:10394 stop:12295 length:1902 start_codon:yes stop_codon:yes gene_type:complete